MCFCNAGTPAVLVSAFLHVSHDLLSPLGQIQLGGAAVCVGCRPPWRSHPQAENEDEGHAGGTHGDVHRLRAASNAAELLEPSLELDGLRHVVT